MKNLLMIITLMSCFSVNCATILAMEPNQQENPIPEESSLFLKRLSEQTSRLWDTIQKPFSNDQWEELKQLRNLKIRNDDQRLRLLELKDLCIWELSQEVLGRDSNNPLGELAPLKDENNEENFNNRFKKVIELGYDAIVHIKNDPILFGPERDIIRYVLKELEYQTGGPKLHDDKKRWKDIREYFGVKSALVRKWKYL